MSHFYGTMTGGRETVRRTGSIQSGMTAHIRGWDAGVQVYAYDDGGVDSFRLIATGGSNDDRAYIMLGVVQRIVTPTGEAVVFKPADGMEYPWQLAQAEQDGYEAGIAAGSWVIDGNTSVETARRIAQGIADGDPEVLDELPSFPLSGEYAGDQTPRDILSRYGIAEDDDGSEGILRAYEEGYACGVDEEVLRSARAVCEAAEV